MRLATLLLISACSDYNLGSEPSKNSPALDTCSCSDTTDLQEEIDSLIDRVHTLESASPPEVPESSMVVTEYEVDCGQQIKQFDLLASDGVYYPMNYIENGTDMSSINYPSWCIYAKVDPLDPPWIIQGVSVYDSRKGLSSTLGGGYEDPFALYGNPWYYNWRGGVGSPVRVHEDGYTLYDNNFEWDCSSGALDATTGNCPVEIPVVRVVIIDDKPALRPEEW